MNKLNSITLIDDDAATNFYHKIVLQRSNCCHHIDVFDDAAKALQHLENTEELPNLIFLDINMPRMNGWEFLDEIMDSGLDKRLKDCKIVVLTTSVNPNDKNKALQYDIVSDYRNKPLNKDTLEEVV